MREELARWLAAAKQAMPVTMVVAGLVLVGAVATWLLVSQRLAAARASERRAEHFWRNIDCVTEPTVAIDMRPLVAHADKATFSALKVITDVRERINAAVKPEADGPDWTPEELAAVKSMTDRSGWPNTTYQPRGFLPRLRAHQAARVTPKDLGDRIARIRAEQTPA